MSILEVALRGVGFKTVEEMLPIRLEAISVQLAKESKACQEAGKLGYKSGTQFFSKQEKYTCPYIKSSKEYRFWWLGFDSAKRDVKGN